MATRQFDQARRFFGKATALEPSFAPAWLGYGHAFAAQDERDQAMAAYRTATRLFPGLHAPVLGMGVEYSQMNNLQLAERTLLTAFNMCKSDPAVSHEMGVVHYKNGMYAAAFTWLDNSLRMLPGSDSCPEAEATLLLMGHCMRKMREYKQALNCYQRALSLQPEQAGVLSAMGYTLQLMGQLDEAIQQYHVALSVQPDDAFARDMLTQALHDFASVE